MWVKYGDKPTDMTVQSQGFIAGITCDRLSGDFDGDGYTDLLTTGTSYNNFVKFISDFRVWKRTASNSTFSQSTPTYNLAGNFEIKEDPFNLYNTIPSDFDGDGRDDILFAKTINQATSGSAREIDNFTIYYPSVGATTFTPITYAPTSFNKINALSPNYLSIGDFDGDGKSDFINFLSNGTGHRIFLTRPTIANNQRVSNPYDGNSNYDGSDFTWSDANYTIDFNGDGKSDIMRIKDGLCEIFEVIASSGANPWELNKIYSSGYPTKWHNIYFGDFNGDRKTDLLTIGSGGVKEIAYSNGVNFITTNFLFNTNTIFNFPTQVDDDKLLIADYNGDGLADIAHCYSKRNVYTNPPAIINIYYSIGNSFKYEQYIDNTNLGFGLGQPLTVDFNGDGRSEIINYNNLNWPFYVLEIKPFGTERLLHKVTDGFNYTTEFNYDRLTSAGTFYDRGNGGNSTYPLNTIQYPFYNVKQVISPNGIGGTNTVDYRYEEARMHRAGRGFLGFTKLKAYDNKSNMLSVTENIFNQTYYLQLQNNIKLYQINNNLQISEEQNNYNLVAIAGAGNRFKIELNNKISNNLLQNIILKTTNTYDNYSNITQSVTTVNNNFETKTINSTYGAFGTTIPYLPISTEVKNTRTGNAQVTKNTKFDYYPNGALKKLTEFAGLPNEVNTEYTYNAYGLKLTDKVSALGMTGRTNTYTYDYKSRFLISTEKNCGSCGANFTMKEIFGYEPLFGNKTFHISTDCNNTSFNYDEFGRPVQTTFPTGAIQTEKYVWDINGNSIYRTENVHSGKPDTKTWFDILNREIKTEVQMMNGVIGTVKSTYKNVGLLKTKTNSYIDGVEIALITSFNYDINGRLITETTPTNNYNYFYTFNTIQSSLAVKKIDAQGSFQTKIKDATGFVKSTEDPGGKLNFYFDSWGNQKRIAQNGITVTTKNFDAYSRLTDITEVNAGTIKYKYDAYGQLIYQEDASNNAYNFVYDDLGRMKTRTGAEGATSYEYYCKSELIGSYDGHGNPISWDPHSNGIIDDAHLPDIKNPIYQSCCNNNITRITGFNGIVQNFSYDLFGRLIQKDELVDGNNYTTSYKYDVNNNIIATIYPDQLEINNIFDNDSYLQQVTRTGGGNFIYQTQDFNGMGQITEYKLGNGLTTKMKYNFGIVTHDNTTGVQQFRYTWDYARGNPTMREDILNGLQENFTYDNLDRLTSAQVLNEPLQEFHYDPHPSTGNTIGNIKVNTEAGYYRYTAQQIHAPSSIANLNSITQAPPNISSNTQNITYTSFQRVKDINENGYTQSFDYWPSYNRVKSELYNNGALQNTRYYFSDFEIQIDASNNPIYIHYISGAEGLCAILKVDASNNITEDYVYKDYLGSITTITDASGTVITKQSFDAWGRERNPADWTYNSIPPQPTWLYRGYTGHESMPEFALINMNARLYDPVQGKMISPDNFVWDATNSQAYNRYAYAHSNPMVYVDPDGNFAWFIPIIAGAIIGGIMNVSAQSTNRKLNFWDGVGAFFTGAVAGAVAGATLSFGLAALTGTSLIGGGSIVTGMTWATSHLSIQIIGISMLTLKTMNFVLTVSSLARNPGQGWDILRGRYYLDEKRTFAGQIIQGVSRFSWEAFQTEFGYGFSHIRNTFGGVNSVNFIRGSTVVNSESGNGQWWGVTIGNYINTNDAESLNGSGGIRTPININNELITHEFGHTLTSRYLGIVYFLYVMPASGLSAKFTLSKHSSRWYERDADNLSRIYLKNHP
jgi:RHS repeat-associated protein